ncbi:MAG: response regulator [Lachnospiraceae bacterium]|nr:response regulator [Lachnospiraceae bacterium]
MENKSIVREKSLTATFILICVVAVIFVAAYLRISSLTEKRCIARMEEGANTVITEIQQKVMRDSRLLNSIATILSNSQKFDRATFVDSMSTFAPMLETMQVRILLPDNTVIEANGDTIDGTAQMSFDELVPLGEHVSNRMLSLEMDNEPVLRHYIPIVHDGETVAILYGVTLVNDLPEIMNVNNIYNSNSSAFIIDVQNGDFIMDTYHEEPGNLYDFSSRKLRDDTSWDEQFKKMTSLQKGYVVFYSEIAEEWFYMYYAPAGINQWEIAVAVPESNAFSNLYAIRRIFYIMASCIAVIMILYYLWVRRNAKETLARTVEKAVLEEKLHKAEAAERAKTMFLSNMSHDIRTPMNAIIGFTTLAQTNIDKKERVQEYLGKILSSSNHLLSLINDILDMSRIESGRLNIEEKECSISDIFRDMRNIIQTQMQTKQLNFFMDTIDVVDEDIYCDKLHLNQVLLNLLGNSIKFTPAGGSVSLTISQKPGAPQGYGRYEIRVKDTGIGMSPEFAVHIFEPFEREKTSTVSGITGTGLGMAITKSIVDTMGGTIELETAPGKGTEFIVTLEFRLQSERKHIEVIHELEGLRALVVDDSFNTCDSVTKMLTQIGMRAEWTMHGKEAVLRARQAVEMSDEFYAYIVDWLLPDLSGIEVVRQIRSIIGDNIPIIIMTAYDWHNIEDEAREVGVTAFCNKPLFLSELRDTLVSVINSKTEPAEEAPIIPVTAEELRGKRILLVEDNELNREIAQELLTESGFVIESAEDGSIAVEIVKNAAPGYYDLILMDVQMPIMNGYEATKAIRKLDNAALANIPIVAMTANAFDEDRKTAMDSGMNAHVAKPINVDVLMGVISDILGKSASEES